MDLSKLSEPFALEDIEWRVSRSGKGSKGIFCRVIAYITARAIQNRLDDVCGAENWKTESPMMIDVNGKSAFAVGISIRIKDEWITKWDVSEPTNIEAAKGGFSGATKRAGAMWSIGRYLYFLDEVFAEVAEHPPTNSSREWNYARLSEKHGGDVYYWRNPGLPAWALPKDEEHVITLEQLNELKRAWRDRFAADVKSPKQLREGFAQFVTGIAGEFPLNDHTAWTVDAMEKCQKRIEDTTDPDDVDSDVPFEE